MIAKAQWKYLGTSPQKVRLVVDQIRGKQVEEALSILRFSPKAAARDVAKVLKSAVANAEHREERVDVDRLQVARAFVNEGPIAKRVRFRAMGRVFRIAKRSCHVTLELDLDGRGASAAPADAPRARAAGRKKVAEAPAAKAVKKAAASRSKAKTAGTKATAAKKAKAGKSDAKKTAGPSRKKKTTQKKADR